MKCMKIMSDDINRGKNEEKDQRDNIRSGVGDECVYFFLTYWFTQQKITL